MSSWLLNLTSVLDTLRADFYEVFYVDTDASKMLILAGIGAVNCSNLMDLVGSKSSLYSCNCFCSVLVVFVYS